MNFYEFAKVFLVISFHYWFTGLIPLEFSASCIMLYVNKVIFIHTILYSLRNDATVYAKTLEVDYAEGT